MSEQDLITRDIWDWIDTFVTAPNDFYDGRFAPCPYARAAVIAETVDVAVWQSGDPRGFVRERAFEMLKQPKLTTRVIALPPRTGRIWGFGDFVEGLNEELVPGNVFLNTGVTKSTLSRYPGSNGEPYFIVVANALEAVLKGAKSLAKSDFYANWPEGHYAVVVERRARLAERLSKIQEPGNG